MPNNKLAVGSAMLQLGNARLVANLILSGLCERYPRLKMVSVESGIGWMPFMLRALDYHVDENDAHGLSMQPSEYFRRQMYACFWFEPVPTWSTRPARRRRQLHVRDRLPPPHVPVPGAAAHIEPTFKAVDDSFRRKVFSENAAHVYNIDLAAL